MSIQTNWNANQTSRPVSESHAWQASAASLPASDPTRGRKRKMAVLTLLTLAMLGGLVYTLPYSPDKTPCFVLVQSGYPAPFPVNGWAAEDVGILQEIDKETISLHRLTPNWRNITVGLQEFSDQLNSRSADAQRSGSCILYINAIGLVDDSGRPCIVPTVADPHDTSTWIPVEELLASLQLSISKDVAKLIVLDCARVDADWDLGVFHNAFVQRVADLVEDQAYSNLIIMTSSSPGEVAWPRSPFALRLMQGLAGVAENKGLTKSKVTAQGLHRFVSSHVRAWASENRGQPQTPMLIGGTTSNFSLTFSLDASVAERLKTRKLSSLEIESPIKATELDELWSSMEALADSPLPRLDPILYRTLQHELLQLEQLANSGPALELQIADALIELKRRIENVNKSDWASLSDQWAAIDVRQPHFLALLKPHDLAVAQAVGSLSKVDVARLRRSIDDAITRSARGEIKTSELADELEEFVESQFIEISRAAYTLAQWPSNQLLSQVALLRWRAQQQAISPGGSVFGDLRAHQFARQSIEEAQISLRQTEDQLWIGGAIDVLDRHVNLTSTKLDVADDRFEQLASAYRIADRLLADLPYFAQWLADSWLLIPGSSTLVDPSAAREQLELLIAASERLIARRAAIDGAIEADQELREAFQLARQQHESFRELLTAYAQSLIDQPDVSPGRMREMQALLRTPVLPSVLRLKLRQREHDLRKQLQQEFEVSLEQSAETDSQVVQTLPPKQTASNRIGQQIAWAPGVASRFVASETDRLDVKVLLSVNSLGQTVDIVNQKMRRALRSCAKLSEIKNAAEELDKIQTADATTEPLEHESYARRAASFWFESPQVDRFELEHLLRLRDLFLWLAQRSLDDCWAGGAANEDVAVGETPFFAKVAADYIQAARAINLPPGASNLKIESLEQRLASQLLLVSGGIRGFAEETSLAPGIGDIDITTRYRTQFPEIPLPEGKAAIFIRSPAAKRYNISAQDATTTGNGGSQNNAFLKLPLDKDSLDVFKLSAQRAAEIEGSVNLVSFFRGLEFLAPLAISSGRGTKIDFEPKRYDSSRVTLFGDARQQPAIVFVLDCSASMADPVPSESPGSTPMSKLEIAKSTLSEMLDDLAQEGTTRVGVIFFGHRLGWSKSSPVRLLTQPRHVLPIPESRSASTDVESVLSLGRFDSTESAKLALRLDDVLPWGQSPLHLGILEAVDAFNQDDPNTDKSVVVITDGVNYQFTPSDRWTAETAPTSLSNVLETVEQRSVPIHILGFAVAPDERRQSRSTFNRIAEVSDGSYRTAENGRDLLRLLQSQLGVGTYAITVNEPSANAFEEEPIEYALNDTIEILTGGKTEASASINFQQWQSDVTLYGGDWLQLQATTQDGIQGIPYEVDFPVTIPMITGDDNRSTGHVCRVHRPVRQDDGVRFMVSMQSQTNAFTRRPSEVWMEVSPVGDHGPSYHFYDAHFQPDEPVPVLRWQASNWPKNAQQALVRFWCKPEPTPATHTVGLSDVMRSRDEFSANNSFPSIPGVTYRIEVRGLEDNRDSIEIRVLEIQDSPSTQDSPLRIDMHAPDIAIRKVERYFDPSNGVAYHSFRIAASDRDQLTAPGNAIRFTTADASHTDAWVIASDSVTVEITSQDAILPIVSWPNRNGSYPVNDTSRGKE